MCCINKNLICIYKFVFHAVFQNLWKDLLKKICIFETAGVIFSKCRKMRNRIQHIQSKKPAVSNVYFNLFYGLTHTFYSIKILNKRYLYQHDRIHTGTTIIQTVFFFYQIINKVPVDCFIYQTKHMILWHHVIHAKHHHLFTFFICIFCHHKKHRLSDKIIIPEKRCIQ